MSILNNYVIYNPSNYKQEIFKDFTKFKNHFLTNINKQFLLLDTQGKEFDQESINQILSQENNDKSYIIYYYQNDESFSFFENTADDILLNQIKIDEILSKYLESKNSYLINSKKVCDDILKRYEDFKEDKERINEFVENYGSIFENSDKKIKEKLLNIINNQELINNMERKMNEVLIYAEKINFLLNLSEIPNIYYEINKDSLKEEYKRRNQFNYLYEKIIIFENELISQEFEKRKKFIQKNFNYSNKLKMEKMSINILNKLFDFEAQQLFLSQTDLYKSNYNLTDGIMKSIDELTEYLKRISENLFSKKKKAININNKIEPNSLNENKNNNNNYSEPFGEIKEVLRSSSVPELKQNKIISIIEKKILNQNINQEYKLKDSSPINNNSNNDLLLSSFSHSGEKEQINQPQAINKIITLFSDTYGKFLWFYEKVYNYLVIYNQKGENKDIPLNKDDPYSVNNYLIEILNENKLLKDKINQIKNNSGIN